VTAHPTKSGTGALTRRVRNLYVCVRARGDGSRNHDSRTAVDPSQGAVSTPRPQADSAIYGDQGCVNGLAAARAIVEVRPLPLARDQARE
jgi:hypothetical protein